jgi:hypothetical protein
MAPASAAAAAAAVAAAVAGAAGVVLHALSLRRPNGAPIDIKGVLRSTQ